LFLQFLLIKFFFLSSISALPGSAAVRAKFKRFSLWVVPTLITLHVARSFLAIVQACVDSGFLSTVFWVVLKTTPKKTSPQVYNDHIDTVCFPRTVLFCHISLMNIHLWNSLKNMFENCLFGFCVSLSC